MSLSSSAAAVSYVSEFVAYSATAGAPSPALSIQSLSAFVAGFLEVLLWCPICALSVCNKDVTRC